MPNHDRPSQGGRLCLPVLAHRNSALTAGRSARVTGDRLAIATSFDRALRA
ncbi:MAG TPA: hypothetical protein VGR46_05295 [Candidatus Limnocylindria bacterium]|nr:hypothetical protein [Candidatus Limnocylindria bacterium]